MANRDEAWLGEPATPDDSKGVRAYSRLYESRAAAPLWGNSPSTYVQRFVPSPKRSGAVAVDLGCGDGRNALHLARLGYSVLAVDYDWRAIDLLKCRLKTFESPQAVQPIQGDVRDFLVPLDCDVIVAYGLLHCLDRPSAVRIIDQWAHSQSCGGLLVVAALTNGVPLPIDHGTHDLHLRAPEEYASLIATYWRAIAQSVAPLQEEHLPHISVHSHEILRGAYERSAARP